MKKKISKKLTLNRETLRYLDPDKLAYAKGAGLAYPTEDGCQTDSCPGDCTNSCQTCAITKCNPEDQI